MSMIDEPQVRSEPTRMRDPEVVLTTTAGGSGPGDQPIGRFARTDPVNVLLDTTLRDVAAVLAEESIGVVLVRGPHGPVGIVSERDLVVAMAEGMNPDRTRARDVMTPDLATVSPHETVAVAARLLLENEIRHLVVADSPERARIISMRDLLRIFAQGRTTSL